MGATEGHARPPARPRFWRLGRRLRVIYVTDWVTLGVQVLAHKPSSPSSDHETHSWERTEWANYSSRKAKKKAPSPDFTFSAAERETESHRGTPTQPAQTSTTSRELDHPPQAKAKAQGQGGACAPAPGRGGPGARGWLAASQLVWLGPLGGPGWDLAREAQTSQVENGSTPSFWMIPCLQKGIKPGCGVTACKAGVSSGTRGRPQGEGAGPEARRLQVGVRQGSR